MVGQTRPYQLFLLFVNLTLAVSGCATMSDRPITSATDEGRQVTQLVQDREKELFALRAEMASTRIAAAKQEAELQELRATVVQLRQENSASHQALFEAKQTLEARQTELAALKADRNQLAQGSSQSDRNDYKLATLENTVTSLSQELTELKQTLTAAAHKPVDDSARLKEDIRADATTNSFSVLRQAAQRIIPAVHVIEEGGSSKPSWITVQPGESWWSLARKHHTTMNTLRTTNGRVGDHLTVGEAIRLP